MKIQILGSNGIIGNGIKQILKEFKIKELNSNSFNKRKNKFILSKFKNCKYFIHAAGVTEEELSINGFERSFNRASIELNNLLNYLKKKRCKNIIYVSSLRLYNEKISILNETDSKLLINNDYKLCHYIAEKTIKNFAHQNNLNYLILRPGAVYGFPKNKMKINRLKLIPYSFPLSLIKKNKIILKSSGNQYRSFCKNTDIGLRVLKWIKNKNRKSLISNIKGDKTIPVKVFAKLCIKNAPLKKSVNYKILINSKDKSKFKKLQIKEKIQVLNEGNLNTFLKEFFRLYQN